MDESSLNLRNFSTNVLFFEDTNIYETIHLKNVQLIHSLDETILHAFNIAPLSLFFSCHHNISPAIKKKKKEILQPFHLRPLHINQHFHNENRRTI